MLDLDCWEALQFPSSLLTSVLVCRNGVKRAHLVQPPPSVAVSPSVGQALSVMCALLEDAFWVRFADARVVSKWQLWTQDQTVASLCLPGGTHAHIRLPCPIIKIRSDSSCSCAAAEF